MLSSDSDVASYRPLETVQAALVRRTRSGAAIGPGQALTLEEALRAHTISAAYALRMEDRIGSIEPGKLADLAVVDADLTSTPIDAIADCDIWLTMLGGDIVHEQAPV